MEDKIRIGISSCLLGNKVRYDGGHQHDRFLTDTLGRYVEYVPVCPEVECGLPVPREALRLVGDPANPRLLTVRSGEDCTDRMKKWAAVRVKELEREELDGFVFKRMSPSSGMERVKVYTEGGMPGNKGVGVFARAFMDHFPHLPVEEDGRLYDPILRENFIQRIFVHKRWRTLLATTRKRSGLVDFHTSHKLLLFSHSEKDYREMGRLVAKAKDLPIDTLFSRYEEMLMATLKKRSTINKQTNVLTHIFGYFKEDLLPSEKQQVLEVLEQYHQGMIPLIVPVTLLNFFVKKFKQEYLGNQHYLDPHPLQLKLLNHA
ncbi:MAG: hypothetical protein VR65_24525 [Desulfobulbaceae bacterium BRH_c16a]|nr:MAG: hypothetical protein VR65_24525 [Desulfobulbaceae bacterium BRH_c16a]